jgi:hypothetical protein
MSFMPLPGSHETGLVRVFRETNQIRDIWQSSSEPQTLTLPVADT